MLLYKLALVLLSAFILGGCAAQQPPAVKSEFKIVAVTFPAYDFARALAGDRAEIVLLVPPGAETHSFEPTPKDIAAIQKCGLFIHTGGRSDEWTAKISQAAGLDDKKTFRLMDNVQVVVEELVEGMQEEEEDEHEGGHEQPEYDEHVWAAPGNVKLIIRALAETLGGADNKNAKLYQERAAAYIAELDRLDAAFRTVVKNGTKRPLLFAGRFPFRYFTDAYGLEYFAAFPGCSTEAEPSAATVAFLIDKAKQEKIPVIFHAELASERLADMICEETGAKKRLMHACHNVTSEEFAKGETYLSLMTRNVATIKEAFQ